MVGLLSRMERWSRGTAHSTLEAGGAQQPVVPRVAGLADRVRLVAGDFFSSVPAECDVYFLRQVIHDWDDARAEKILRTVRAAMQPGPRVLIYDMQRPHRISPHPAFSLDLMMMVVTDGGRERSVTEMQALLARCGFRPGRVTPLAAPLGVVEGVAV